MSFHGDKKREHENAAAAEPLTLRQIVEYEAAARAANIMWATT